MKPEDITILLADDEKDILEIIGYNLSQQGYNIITAKNGIEAVEKAKTHLPKLIILDVMMPEMDGIEACEEIRKDHNLDKTIITFLTARGEDYSQVAGFNAGADDYITKPIRPKVLVSKITALLRRFRQSEIEIANSIQQKAGLVIDKDSHSITIDGHKYELPKKEFQLLCLLTTQPGKVYKREEILQKVWGSEIVVSGRTLDVHIRKLREKIGDGCIKTIKGVGYKYEF